MCQECVPPKVRVRLAKLIRLGDGLWVVGHVDHFVAVFFWEGIRNLRRGTVFFLLPIKKNTEKGH